MYKYRIFLFLFVIATVTLTSCPPKDDNGNNSGRNLTGTSWTYTYEDLLGIVSMRSVTFTLTFTKEGVGVHTQTGWYQRSVMGVWQPKENVNVVNEITYTYNASSREGFITESTRQPFYISPDFQKLTWGNNIYTRK